MQCPECQTALPDSANFCLKCGHKLGQQSKFSSAPGAERKRVTALFSDLSGYTAMTEKLDPEEIKKITSTIFNEIKKVVSKYGGFIQMFAGDGVLVLFGIPKVHEDDPIRAIFAAKEIHEHVESISPQFEPMVGRALSMHSGVNTGLAVTEDVNLENGTQRVTGDAINVASRLSDLAAAGEILVGQNTYKATKSHFEYQPLNPALVKGRTEPVSLFRLLSVKSSVSHGEKSRQIFSEMVGRDQELSMLELQVLKAINGEGSIVNVIGEAGIGKSRLIAELKNREIMKKVAFREGRAISIGKGLSFYPVIEIFKNWAKIKEGDIDKVSFDKLKASIRSVTPKDADEILPFIAVLIGIKMTGRYADRVKGIEGEVLEKLILKNVKDLLIKSSKLIPLVIVFEDLHWADLSTIELLESIFRLVKTQRIVFINVFRPKYTEISIRIGQTARDSFSSHYTEIKLQPLNDQLSEKLISNILNISGLPHSLRESILKRSEGNPFFIEEVVRSFIDDGAIIKINGGFEITEKIDSVVIPHSINDVLIARIDRLEDRTRELVKTASVIGRSFFYRILKEVIKSLGDIDTKLDYLKEIQLIREQRRMEELEYIFKHALTQEAAYGSLLIKKRKELHLIIAQTIEIVFGEKLHEFYGMLAYHYSKGEDLEKAEQYMVKAGEQAIRSSASSEALSYYQEALKLYINSHGDKADSEKLAMFEKNIALAYFYKGNDTEAIKYFDRVLDRWGAGSSKNQIIVALKLLFDLLALIAHLYLPSVRQKKIPDERDNEILDLSYKKALSLVQVNLWGNLTEQIGTVKKALRFNLNHVENGIVYPLSASGILVYLGLYKFAKRLLDYSYNFLDENNVKELLIFHFYEAFHKTWAGDYEGLRHYDPKLIDLNVKIGEFWHVACYIATYTGVEAARGEFEKAKIMYGKLYEISETYESHCTKIWYYTSKIFLHVNKRDFFDTEDLIDKSISFASRMGMDQNSIFFLSFGAYAWIFLKDFDKADEYIKRASELDLKHKIVLPFCYGLYQTAKLKFYFNSFENAIISEDTTRIAKYRAKVRKIAKIAIKATKKSKLNHIECLRLKGSFNWLLGKQKKAIKCWQKALSLSGKIGLIPDLARTYMEIGKRFIEEKSKYKELNDITAEQYLEMAGEMFKEMDLQWDLDELDQIVSYK